MKKLLILVSIALCLLSSLSNAGEDKKKLSVFNPEKTGLVVHEWGVMLHEADDEILPDFIYRHKAADLVWDFPAPNEMEAPIESFEECKKPVIYFYTDKERTLDCSVGFGNTLPTHWYPKAEQTGDAKAELEVRETWAREFLAFYVEGLNGDDRKKDKKEKADRARDAIASPFGRRVVKDGITYDLTPTPEMQKLYRDNSTRIEELRQLINAEKLNADNALLWKNVTLSPNARENFKSPDKGHWIESARNVDACPLSVNGENEKFLFYEGMRPATSNVRAQNDDQEVILRNTGKHDVHDLLLIRVNNLGKIKILKLEGLKAGDKAVPAKWKGAKDYEHKEAAEEVMMVLENAGLYTKEALRVTQIWQKEFFAKAGTRVIHRWDSKQYDESYPLTLSVQPDEIKRVMLDVVEIK